MHTHTGWQLPRLSEVRILIVKWALWHSIKIIESSRWDIMVPRLRLTYELMCGRTGRNDSSTSFTLNRTSAQDLSVVMPLGYSRHSHHASHA